MDSPMPSYYPVPMHCKRMRRTFHLEPDLEEDFAAFLAAALIEGVLTAVDEWVEERCVKTHILDEYCRDLRAKEQKEEKERKRHNAEIPLNSVPLQPPAAGMNVTLENSQALEIVAQEAQKYPYCKPETSDQGALWLFFVLLAIVCIMKYGARTTPTVTAEAGIQHVRNPIDVPTVSIQNVKGGDEEEKEGGNEEDRAEVEAMLKLES